MEWYIVVGDSIRELKFRAWHVKEKKMIPDLTYFALLDARLNNINAWKRKDIIKMQCTGILDKNKQEIYEGDIVSKHDNQIHFTYKGEVTFGIVELETDFGFQHNPMCWKVDDHPIDNTFEVIGNVFENPAVLENSP